MRTMLSARGLIVAAALVGISAVGTTAALAQSGTTTPQAQQHRMRSGEDRSVGDRYTAALNLLLANSYTGVTSIAQDGNEFRATAWHNGQQVTVRVDPTTGSIQPLG